LAGLIRAGPFIVPVAAGALYAALYQFLPTGSPPSPSEGTTALWPKLLYLMQSITYPVSWVARFAPKSAGQAIAAAGFVATVAATAWLARARANRQPLLVGWAWWALCVALIALTLPTYYIEHGARLLYLSAVGIALVWSQMLRAMALMSHHGPRIAAAALIIALGSASLFVRGRLGAYAEIATPLEVIGQALPRGRSSKGILLVNLPEWLTPGHRTYGTGAEYVPLLGRHIFAEELIEENRFIYRPVLAVAAPELRTQPGYYYGVHDQAQLDTIQADWAPAGCDVFVTEYGPENVRTRYAGELIPPSGLGETRLLAEIGSHRLFAGSAVQCGDAVIVELQWGAQAGGQGSPRLSLALEGSDGQTTSRWEGWGLGLGPGRLELPQGWIMLTHHELDASSATPQHVLVRALDPEPDAAIDGAPWRIPVERGASEAKCP
jgi:hypothetical protein